MTITMLTARKHDSPDHLASCVVKGLFDVLDPADLADLTADDLQLLLSGTGGFLTVRRYTSASCFHCLRG